MPRQAKRQREANGKGSREQVEDEPRRAATTAMPNAKRVSSETANVRENNEDAVDEETWVEDVSVIHAELAEWTPKFAHAVDNLLARFQEQPDYNELVENIRNDVHGAHRRVKEIRELVHSLVFKIDEVLQMVEEEVYAVEEETCEVENYFEAVSQLEQRVETSKQYIAQLHEVHSGGGG